MLNKEEELDDDEFYYYYNYYCYQFYYCSCKIIYAKSFIFLLLFLVTASLILPNLFVLLQLLLILLLKLLLIKLTLLKLLFVLALFNTIISSSLLYYELEILFELLICLGNFIYFSAKLKISVYLKLFCYGVNFRYKP